MGWGRLYGFCLKVVACNLHVSMKGHACLILKILKRKADMSNHVLDRTQPMLSGSHFKIMMRRVEQWSLPY